MFIIGWCSYVSNVSLRLMFVIGWYSYVSNVFIGLMFVIGWCSRVWDCTIWTPSHIMLTFGKSYRRTSEMGAYFLSIHTFALVMHVIKFLIKQQQHLLHGHSSQTICIIYLKSVVARTLFINVYKTKYIIGGTSIHAITYILVTLLLAYTLWFEYSSDGGSIFVESHRPYLKPKRWNISISARKI